MRPRAQATPRSAVSDQASVVAALAAASRWTAERHVEEQAFVETEAGRIFTTAFRPRGPARAAGFLLCHSFAWEQAELYALELLFARTAAAAGFPVLSFQATGYGDAGGDFADVTLETMVRDAVAAAALLASWEEVQNLVPVGARLGASVAVMMASRIGASGVALWNPSLEPGRYLDGLLKVKSMAGMMDGAGGARLGALKAELLAGGTVDLIGHPLTAACYREAHASDPLAAVPVPARALLVAVNPAARRQVDRASERLSDAGATVRIEDAEGEGRSAFGLGMPLSGHLATNRTLFEDIARRTIAWAEESW
ncbi:MAG TPA: hypothetical protein VGB52_00800 [Actinomycetota bacterium]